MPAVSAPAKVLVTGANGFIAIWVVRTLLEAGYAVRATVRSKSKGGHLEKIFKDYGDKLEIVIVEDITKEGAFDDAVKGVDAIEHTASPFHMNAKTPDDMIKPAVGGTVSVLKSALKNAPTVKRIVVTSSVAAVLQPSSSPKTYTEADWNEFAIEECKTKGDKAHPGLMYQASKTLAEKAAWDFVKEHKSEIGWELVVLNPPYVFGPVIHEVSSPDALNTSAYVWFNTVLKSPSEDELKGSYGWIDVRDLALAHLKGIEAPDAGNERYIVSAGSFVFQEWLDAANALTPPPLGSYKLPKGKPEIVKGFKYPVVYDTRKAASKLGLTKYLTMEDTARDTMKVYGAKGWVN